MIKRGNVKVHRGIPTISCLLLCIITIFLYGVGCHGAPPTARSDEPLSHSGITKSSSLSQQPKVVESVRSSTSNVPKLSDHNPLTRLGTQTDHRKTKSLENVYIAVRSGSKKEVEDSRFDNSLSSSRASSSSSVAQVSKKQTRAMIHRNSDGSNPTSHSKFKSLHSSTSGPSRSKNHDNAPDVSKRLYHANTAIDSPIELLSSESYYETPEGSGATSSRTLNNSRAEKSKKKSKSCSNEQKGTLSFLKKCKNVLFGNSKNKKL